MQLTRELHFAGTTLQVAYNAGIIPVPSQAKITLFIQVQSEKTKYKRKHA
jgi:hypothetical protein